MRMTAQEGTEWTDVSGECGKGKKLPHHPWKVGKIRRRYCDGILWPEPTGKLQQDVPGQDRTVVLIVVAY
jgi:hypothetical protein